MAEYINKWTVVDMLTDLENQLQQHKPFNDTEREMYRKICETEIAIGKTQAADVVEAVHGEWNDSKEYYLCVTVKCSSCSEEYPLWAKRDFNFCPNCGADMRKE